MERIPLSATERLSMTDGNTLILLFHPNFSASKSNKTLIEKATTIPGVKVVDMYAKYPDGKIDVDAEHELLDNASHVILQFPMHWYSAPALAQQWEDETLSWGWAYGGGRHLLGKTLHVALTTGAPESAYTDKTRASYINALLAPFTSTALRVHMNWGEPFVFYGDGNLAAAAERYGEFLKNLD